MPSMLSKKMIPKCSGVFLVVMVICCTLIVDLECKRHSKEEKRMSKFSKEVSKSNSEIEDVDDLNLDASTLEYSEKKSIGKYDGSTYSPLSESDDKVDTLSKSEVSNSMPDIETVDSSNTETTSKRKRKKLKPKYVYDEELYDYSDERSQSSQNVGIKSRSLFTDSDFEGLEENYASKESASSERNVAETNEGSTDRISKTSEEITSNSKSSYDEDMEGKSKTRKNKINDDSKDYGKRSRPQGDRNSQQKHITMKEKKGGSEKSDSLSNHEQAPQSQVNDIKTVHPIDFTTDYDFYFHKDLLNLEKDVFSTPQSSTNYQTSMSDINLTTVIPSKPTAVDTFANTNNKKESADKLNIASPRIIIKPPFTVNKKCKERTPPCCISGQIDINLGTIKYRARVKGALDGVNAVVSEKAHTSNKRCSNGAVIEVSFESIGNEGCFGCTQGPLCGRRLLQLDLDLSRNRRRNTLLYITDSHSKYEGAIVHAVFPHIAIYPHNSTGNSSTRSHVMIKGAMNSRTNQITVYIGNQFIRVTNDNRLDENFCMNDLFHLNGRFDLGDGGTSPNKITIGLNQRIPEAGDERSFGICSASLKWACPWKE